MFGTDDTIRKNKKVLETVKLFLENNGPTADELSKITGYSKSSIQRYLTDPYLNEILDENTIDTIKNLLNRNKEDGQQKGGVNSSLNNIPLKDNQGRFIANKKIR